MKRLLPLGLATAFILSAVVLSSPVTVNAQSAGLVSSVLNRLEKNRASLKSLRAGISMEKYNSQLRSSDNYNGVVLYMPGGGRNASVKLEWKSPAHEILSFLDGKYKLLRVRQGVMYVGTKTPGNGTADSIVSMMYLTRQQLESRFQPVRDVREETLWGGVTAIHLTLVPKGNASYKYAEVWIDGGGMPIQTKVVEKNDDSTTMRLSALEKNVPLSTKDFDFKVDPNVKIVKS